MATTPSAIKVTPDASPFNPPPPSLAEFQSRVESTILSSPKPPSEEEVLSALRSLRTYAPSHHPAPAPSPPARAPSVATSAASSLLSSAAPQKPVRLVPAAPEKSEISELAFQIVSHPNIFLTPAVLKTYLTITSSVRDPSDIPAVLHLYAHKPAPGAKKANARSARNAVPEELAQEALEQTLRHGNMELSLDVVDLAFAAPAWRRRKLLTQVFPALGVFAATPLALYGLASKMATLQDIVPEGLATQYAFAGLCAYAGFTVTIGLVALTTSNDQMVRVTWVRGTPLRERWMRERERAGLDEVAQWWGFRGEEKRGEEEGGEWELLREVVGRKGMVLDETSLMKGME